jgi:hypothetical protein
VVFVCQYTGSICITYEYGRKGGYSPNSHCATKKTVNGKNTIAAVKNMSFFTTELK